MVVEITLKHGLVALVDDEDAALADQYRWHAHKDKNTWYARTHLPTAVDVRRPLVSLHRLVMNAPPGLRVDHKNGNGLDCRRGNLRFANNAQNCANKKAHANGTGGFKGVSRRGRQWVARIHPLGQYVGLGTHATAEAAAAAYDAAAIRHFGEFARTNFASRADAERAIHEALDRLLRDDPSALQRRPSGRPMPGEQNGSAKLTEADVLAIRARCAEGQSSYEQIGREYGVAGGTIRNIAHRRNWRHLEDNCVSTFRAITGCEGD